MVIDRTLYDYRLINVDMLLVNNTLHSINQSLNDERLLTNNRLINNNIPLNVCRLVIKCWKLKNSRNLVNCMILINRLRNNTSILNDGRLLIATPRFLEEDNNLQYYLDVFCIIGAWLGNDSPLQEFIWLKICSCF